MNKRERELLKDFDNLVQALMNAKYYSIAVILRALKQVFIKEIR